MRTATEVIYLIGGAIALIFAFGVAYNKILYRMQRAEKDINGVGGVSRRLIGNLVRNAACAEHDPCARCREKREQAARLIEGR